MTYLKLTIEYDGTDFSGWQSQTNARTVQDVLERSIERVTGETVRIAGAGRTDAGVHARGQVASLKLAGNAVPNDLKHSLNGVLPPDVAIRDAEKVSPDFNARYSAVARRYTYTIHAGPTALYRRTAWSVGWKLNTSYLAQSGEMFLGKHDFRSFAKVGTDVKDWVCDVRSSEWTVGEDLLTYTIEANRFMYGMVRALVGTMVEVGRSYRPLSDIPRIIHEKDRTAAGMAAPARGLCLVTVLY